MPKEMDTNSNPDRNSEGFVTIDDLLQKAKELFLGMETLCESKYPLDIRRGIGKGVENEMATDQESKQVKASGRTYFFDINKTNEEKAYMRITESRKGEGEKWKRSSVVIFPEDAKAFVDAVNEMVTKLG